MEHLKDAIATAQQQADQIEADVNARRHQELLGTAGSLLGALLSGRSTSTKISRAASALGGASSRRSMTSRAEGRLDTAKEKAQSKEADLQQLEAEVTTEVTQIHDAWMAKADQIDELAIGLEKTDIDIAEVAVVWVPTRST
jgi:hypothetical protein